MKIDALTSSESNEWYTPARYIAVVRRFFGGQIDLDPCSSEYANRTVQALRYWTIADNALRWEWYADNVFMNPPYGKVQNKSQAGVFCHYMLDQQENFKDGIILVNSCTGSKWFQPLFNESICFVDHRIHYDVPEGVEKKSQPTKDNVFVYIGERVNEFEQQFRTLGRIRIASKHLGRYMDLKK